MGDTGCVAVVPSPIVGRIADAKMAYAGPPRGRGSSPSHPPGSRSAGGLPSGHLLAAFVDPCQEPLWAVFQAFSASLDRASPRRGGRATSGENREQPDGGIDFGWRPAKSDRIVALADRRSWPVSKSGGRRGV